MQLVYEIYLQKKYFTIVFVWKLINIQTKFSIGKKKTKLWNIVAGTVLW